RILRDAKNRGGIANIDVDDGLLWHRVSDGFKEGHGEGATSRGVDDKISRKRFAHAVRVLVSDTSRCRTVGRGDNFLRTAALPQHDVGVLFHSPPHGQLDQRPGHRMREQIKIALWKGIKAGALDANVEADTQRNRAGCAEVVLEAGKQLAECTLT